MDDRDDGACVEGADLPDLRPLRVILYASQYASILGGEFEGIICSGIAPLQRLGQQLLALNVSPNRKIRVERGGIHIGEATVGQAANGELNNVNT